MNKYLETLTQSLNFYERNWDEVACPRSMGDSVLPRQPNRNAPECQKADKVPRELSKT